MSRKITRRPLSFQQLEDRTVLAGDVSADVINGQLVLTGDNLGNQIEITQTAGNYYKVKGLNGTEINGKSDRTFRVTGGMTLNMNGGNDAVTIGSELFAADIGGNLTINGGLGLDTIILSNVDVHGNLNINGGDADDIVRVAGTVIDNGLNITTGQGADEVQVAVTTVFGATSINTGSEDDEVELLAATFKNNVKIETQGGDDTVNIEIVNAQSKTITVLTGDDEDFVNVRAVTADKFFAELGSDDDEIRFKESKFNLTDLDGDAGDNFFTDLGQNQFGTFLFDDFE